MHLEQQLREALAPCEPGPEPEALIMARVSAAAWRASHVTRRRPSRVILIGTVLVVAAAAAMLALQPENTPARRAVVAPVSAPGTGSVAEVAVPLPVHPELPAPLPAEEGPASAQTFKPFTVFVPPLQNFVQDANDRAVVETVFAALLRDLHAVPGIILLGPEENAAAAEAAAEYRVTLRAERIQRSGGIHAGNKFTVNVVVVRKSPATGFPGEGLSIGFDSAEFECPAPARQSNSLCDNPESTAAKAVDTLRKTVFPADPSLRRQLQARVLDPALDYNQRLQALADLGGLKRASAGTSNSSDLSARALADPGAVRAAAYLASTATDPAVRAQVWRTMRGVPSAALIQPLLRSFREDPEPEVRLEALTTLSMDFIDNAAVRSVLNTIAREDASPLVRALAQRGPSGEAAWKDYVFTSLKDSRRPDAERVEALMLHVIKPGLTGPTMSSSDLKRLDEEAARAVAQMLPGLVTTPDMQRKTRRLLESTGLSGRPVMVEVLIDIVDRVTDPEFRLLIVQALGQQPGARARAALARISTQDADPALRRSAAQALDTP